jgi:hypothetical protein
MKFDSFNNKIEMYYNYSILNFTLTIIYYVT